MTGLCFEDRQGYDDFATFVGRARSLDADGAMRLSVSGTVLAAYVGVLSGRGLLGEGAVVGLRTARLAEPASLDTTVSLAALADRLAFTGSAGAGPGGSGATAPGGEGTAPVRDAVLAVPPTTVSAGWAALTPPRSGWEPVGSVPAGVLADAARAGIAEVALGVEAAGGTAGGHAVSQLRERVWGRLTATAPPVPAGGAFAAYVLGFLDESVDPECAVLAHGRWTRLSTQAGHVLVR